MIRLSRSKKQKLLCHVTAVDKIVIARKDQLFNDKLLKQTAHLPDSEQKEITLKETKTAHHIDFLKTKPGYGFLTKMPHSLTVGLLATPLNGRAAAELEWLSGFPYFYHNTLVVTLMTAMMRYLEDGQDRAHTLYRAGLLHNTGMTRLPESILQKNSLLEDDERSYIYQHPIYSALLMSYYLGEGSEEETTIALQHHERDGYGYPKGEKPEHRESSWIRLCDRFTALISSRPYRPAITLENAFDIIDAETAANIHSKHDVALLKQLF